MAKRSRIDDIKTMKKLFDAAEAAAHAVGEREPGAEHLVLAALLLDDGSARRAFVRAGADPEEFAPAVERVHQEALREVGITSSADLKEDIQIRSGGRGVFKSKGSLSELFQDASNLSRSERSNLCGAYIVLAAARRARGTTARAIEMMGTDRAVLAAAARVEIDLLNA